MPRIALPKSGGLYQRPRVVEAMTTVCKLSKAIYELLTRTADINKVYNGLMAEVNNVKDPNPSLDSVEKAEHIKRMS